MKIYKLAIILIVIILIVLGFKIVNKDSYEKTTFTYTDYFDTYINVTFYEEVDPEVEKLIEDKLSSIDNVTTNFDNNKNSIFALNQTSEIESNSDLENIIENSVNFYNDYSTQFNIAIGNLIDIWKSHLDLCNEQGECTVPTIEELQEANTNNNPNDIKVTKNSISIKDGMKIDLGGVAKGYAADEISTMLQDNGYENFLINAGGNVVTAKKPGADKFVVSVVDPSNLSSTFITFLVEDKAVVTSGDYERFYEVDGNRYSHLINTETLYPSTNFRSVTVIAPTSTQGDMWSTALFNMSMEDGIQLVESQEDIEAVWYTANNEVIKSSGVKDYEEE